jgi:hypothetical protein
LDLDFELFFLDLDLDRDKAISLPCQLAPNYAAKLKLTLHLGMGSLGRVAILRMDYLASLDVVW